MTEYDRHSPEHPGDRDSAPAQGSTREGANTAGSSDTQRDGGLLDRRTLLKGGLLAGGALAAGGAALADIISKQGIASAGDTPVAAARAAGAPGTRETARAQASPQGRRAPNILVIMVDQLRAPQGFSAGPIASGLMPNLARLRNGGVSFASHYTAANDCTPARATLLTGLHTHQTGCMITGGSTLDPGFPTWGTMLREQGYRSYWYGKWHLTHGDNQWDSFEDSGALEPYGFTGGTYPSPDGAPGQGWRVDPHIVTQFEQWFARAPKHEPWCTTVSFVNPHDIAWWYRWSERTATESEPPRLVQGLPPNFETPEEMAERGKPLLQRSLQDTAQASFGAVPYDGPDMAQTWLPFMDLYLKLLGDVDSNIGAVLNTLASRPDVAANTVVVFTSDHGEYGASHGMRGKGGSAYEEAIRVPLIVNDLRGRLTRAPERERGGLTSSVDVAPLMLSIATGSEEWRKDSHYSHLAGRHDLAAMLRNPSAPGRPYVLHATDEIVTEFAIEPYAAEAPLHVVALRTPTAKFATYSDFVPDSIKALTAGREVELYDYSTAQGRMELHNAVGESPLEDGLSAEMKRAVRDELREPLPGRLSSAHKRGFANYFKVAARAVVKAAERRRERSERELEVPLEEGLESTTTLHRRRGSRHT